MVQRDKNNLESVQTKISSSRSPSSIRLLLRCSDIKEASDGGKQLSSRVQHRRQRRRESGDKPQYTSLHKGAGAAARADQ